MGKSSFHRQLMEDMNPSISQRVQKESVKKALEDGIDYSEGALYFVEKTMANPKNVSWFDEALTRLFTYQGHSFYK